MTLKLRANPYLPLILFGGIFIPMIYIGIAFNDLIALIVGTLAVTYSILVFVFYSYFKINKGYLTVCDGKLKYEKIPIFEIKQVYISQGYRSIVPILNFKTSNRTIKVNIMLYSNSSLKKLLSNLKKVNPKIKYWDTSLS